MDADIKKEITIPESEQEKSLKPSIEHRILVIHDSDQDGFCAANIIKDYKKQPSVAVGLVEHSHGVELRRVVIDPNAWDEIFITDLAVPLTFVIDLLNNGLQVTVIDHHDSTIEAFSGFQHENFCAKVGKDKSAAGLAWEHLHNTEMPWVVKMVNDWDIWNHEDPQVIPFHYGMECIDMRDSKVWRTLLKGDPQSCAQIMQMGQLVGSYWVNKQNDITAEHSFIHEVDGIKFLVCNGWFSSSYDFASTFDTTKFDALMWFRFKPENADRPWTISMRTSKEGINILPIAEKYFGGSGHTQSCGANLTTNELIEWFPGDLDNASSIINNFDTETPNA